MPGNRRGLPRLWNAELAIRPLGTDRLELAFGGAHANDDDWERIVPRARFWVKLVDGLRLYSEGERVPAGSAAALEGGADSRAGRRPGDGLRARRRRRRRCTARSPGRAATAAASRRASARLERARRPELVGPAYVVRVSLEVSTTIARSSTLVRGVRALAADKPVAAVLFKVENVQLGTARIEELRELMAFLRAHGKRVFAYAPSPSTREYYLASAADAIVLHPAGELALTGISQTRDVLQARDGPARRPRRSGAHRRSTRARWSRSS